MAVALTLGVGCAGGPPAAKPHSVEVAAAPQAQAEPLLAPARAARGCTVTETEIDGLIHLRFELQGNSLALLRDAEARLDLGGDPRFVELERGGVMLRTPYDATERPLHLRRALALGGVVTPKPWAEVVPQRPSPDGQVVRFVTSAELGRASIDEAVECADISLNTHAYDVHAEPQPPGTPMQLSGEVGVRATPGGAAALQLDLKRAIVVDELERQADQVKIRVETATELLSGWVPAAVVGVVNIERASGGHSGGMGFGNLAMRTHIQYSACPQPVTLYAASEDRLGEVGVVRAGTRFEIGERVERGALAGFSQVNFWQLWIMPDTSARFMLPSVDLARCSRAR